MRWDAASNEAITTGTSTTLTFTSGLHGGCGGSMLDAIKVEELGPGDAPPPVITPTVTGTLGTNGWYTSDVNVSWTAADGMSGIASSSGCTARTTSTDNAGTSYPCTATNGAGLTATKSVSAKRDATKPSIGYTGNAGTYTVDQSVAISCAASFTVSVTGDGVCALVNRWVSNAGVANSMCVKLRQGSYDAFRNELSAQSGKKITDANAAILLRLVNLLGQLSRPTRTKQGPRRRGPRFVGSIARSRVTRLSAADGTAKDRLVRRSGASQARGRHLGSARPAA